MFDVALINRSGFDFNKFDKDFKLPEIRVKFQDFVKDYSENYDEYNREHQPLYQRAIGGVVSLLAGNEDFNGQVKDVVQEHSQINTKFAQKIKHLQERWSSYMVAPADLTANHAAFTREYYEIHEKFLEEQLSFVNFYLETLNNMESGKLIYEFQKDDFKGLKTEIANVQAQLQAMEAKLKEQKKAFNQRQAKPQKEEIEAYKQLYDLVILLSSYTKRPQEVLAKLSQDITTFREYAKNHPSPTVKRALTNLSLVYQLLNEGQTNFKLLRSQLEKSLLVDALMPEYVTQTDDKDMPESIRKICSTLEILPKVIGVFQGMHSGTFIPLQQIGFIADALDVPGAWLFPFIDIVLGGYTGFKGIELIQEAPQCMTSHEKMKLISFTKMLEREYATMEELQDEERSVANYAFVRAAEKAQIVRKDLFKRIETTFKDFALVMHFADWKERTVRIIGQVIIPAVILTSIVVAAIAGVILLLPEEIAVIAVSIAGIASVIEGAQASYNFAMRLSNWIDEYYENTVDKAQRHKKEIQDKIEEQKALETLQLFLNQNKADIAKMVREANKQFRSRVHRGEFDKYLRNHRYKYTFEKIDSKDLNQTIFNCRLRFIEQESKNIQLRLIGAAFFKTYGMSDQTVKSFITHFNAGMDHLEEIKKIAGFQKNWAENRISEVLTKMKIAESPKEAQKRARMLLAS